jgi:hypothetical protein
VQAALEAEVERWRSFAIVGTGGGATVSWRCTAMSNVAARQVSYLVPRFLYLHCVGLNNVAARQVVLALELVKAVGVSGPHQVTYSVPRLLYIYWVGLNKEPAGAAAVAVGGRLAGRASLAADALALGADPAAAGRR